jgi:hypothetical protein
MQVTITSGRNGFVLLDRIGTVDEKSIDGAVFLPARAPYFCIIEAMAQLGAMHARYMHSFDLHVFLLKINWLNFFSKDVEEGWYSLRAMLQGTSDKASSYQVQVSAPSERSFAQGQLCFAFQDYNHVFQEKQLKKHYKDLFACLRKKSNGVC